MSNSDDMKPKGLGAQDSSPPPTCTCWSSLYSTFVFVLPLTCVTFTSNPNTDLPDLDAAITDDWWKCLVQSTFIYLAIITDTKRSNLDYPQEVKEGAMCECTREPFHYYVGGAFHPPLIPDRSTQSWGRKEIKTYQGRLFVRTDYTLFIP